jgi:hypothetical protein
MTTVTHRQRRRIHIRESADPAQWETYAAATGLVAAVCMIAGYAMLLAADQPSSADPAALQAFYADEGKRNLLSGSWLAVCFGAAFSVWFLGTLRAVLRRAEGEQGRVASIAYGAGVASVIMFVIGSALKAALAGAVTWDDSFAYDAALDAHLAGVLNSISYGVLAPAGILAAVLVAATALVTLRTGVFPRWFGIAGIVAAVVLVLTPVLDLLPVLLIPLWTIAASVLAIQVATGRHRIVDVRAAARTPGDRPAVGT